MSLEEDMPEEFTVHGFELSQVPPRDYSWFTLLPVELPPSEEERGDWFVPIPEPFTHPNTTGVRMQGMPVVFAWTKNTLQMIDRLGLAFPVSVSLRGPVSMVSSADGRSVVQVWYSTWSGVEAAEKLEDGAFWLVEELMAKRLKVNVFSYEERRFLVEHYPSQRVSSRRYGSIMNRLLDEVK